MRRALLVLVLVVGCGKDGTQGGQDDGGLIDGNISPDSNPFDAAPTGQANVTTFSRCCVGFGEPGARVGGVAIIVTNPDGSIETTTTDSNGEATVELSAGASVTAFYGDAGSETGIATFLGVQPGDQLVYGKTWLADEASIGAMTFNWPPDAMLDRVDVYTACGSNWADATAGTTSKLFYPSCAGEVADVVFVGHDPGGTLLRWGVVTGQAFVDGGTVSLPAWEVPGALTLSTNGVPPEIANATIYAIMMLTGRETYNYVRVSGTPTEGELSGSRPWAPMGESLRVYGRFSQLPFPGAAGTLYGVHHVYMATAPDVTQVTIADPITMPWMSEVLVSPETGELSWAFEGEGDWDATRLEIFYNRNLPESGFRYYRWTVILPPGLDHATLPALPAEMTQFAPASGDSITVSGGLFDLGEVAGYDEARQRPEWHFPERSWIGAVPDELIKVSGGPSYE